MKIALRAGLTLLTLPIVTSAYAADLAPAPRPYTKAPPMESAYNWTGFYVGVNGGYGWDNRSTTLIGDPLFIGPAFQPAGIVPTSLKAKADGWLAGGQIGYNWQAGRWVYGLEADIDGADIKGSQSYSVLNTGQLTTTHLDRHLDWLGTVRARLGYTPVDRLLVYGTGGLAFGHASASLSVMSDDCTTGICMSDTQSKTMAGWTAGFGLEYALDNHWSIKGEYLYYDLGNLHLQPTFELAGIGTASLAASVAVTGNIARMGINYKF